MAVAVLIGFEYVSSKQVGDMYKYRSLPGTIIDLYRMYKLIEGGNFDAIFVVTDIQDFSKIKTLGTAIIDGIVDSDIYNFIDKLQNDEQYLYCSTRSSFLDILDHILTVIAYYRQNSVHLLLYYSGHATDKCLILPNHETLYQETLCQCFLSSFLKYDQLILIFDCCHGFNFSLAFTYNFRYPHPYLTYTLSLDSDIKFYPSSILCLSSASKFEDASSTSRGSFFTLALTEILANSFSYHIISLVNTLTQHCLFHYGQNYKQNIQIWSSYPHLFLLWSWLWRPNLLSISFSDSHLLISRWQSSTSSYAITFPSISSSPSSPTFDVCLATD